MGLHVGARVKVIKASSKYYNQFGTVKDVRDPNVWFVRMDGNVYDNEFHTLSLEVVASFEQSGAQLDMYGGGYLTEYESQKDRWKKEGRCPDCGELGRIHLSTMICSTHGPY